MSNLEGSYSFFPRGFGNVSLSVLCFIYHFSKEKTSSHMIQIYCKFSIEDIVIKSKFKIILNCIKSLFIISTRLLLDKLINVFKKIHEKI